MRSLEDFTTTEELNKWASGRGLMNDDMVNLRRVQLMADAVTNQREMNRDYVCDACGQRFTEKTHLLRHKRTIHSDKKQHQCSVCFTKFNRLDSLQRHSKVHSRKRKCVENENDLPPAKISNTKTTAVCEPAKTTSAKMRHCNWCTQNKVLLPNKKFCADCGQQGRECKWCHRPLPERFYSERTDICDRCVKRGQNWKNRRQQGGGQINALEGTAQSEVIEPNAGNLWDILQFFVDNKVLIQTILTDRLTNVKGSSATYYGDKAMSWKDAISFCESLSGSIGIRDIPIWPDYTVPRALWTAKSRGQHPNYPQMFNGSASPETAYIASIGKNKQCKLKLRDASYEYPFICEYRSSNCGGNLTSSSGIIESPGFPSSYGYNLFCKWKVTVTNGYHVRLEFTSFQLEEHELCLYDFVKIIGTTDHQDTKFCGNIIPRLHQSEGNNLTIIFKSDNSLSGTGFQASWLTVPRNDAENEANASTTDLNGAGIAGIVLGTVLVIVLLLLTIYIICKKRQKTETQPLTVTNQIYGLSSLTDEPITEAHSYMNVTDRVTEASRQPDVVEQCYSTPARGNVQDNIPNETDGYEYETVAENRLESDALEFCQNSGSQANLIASDGEDSIDTDLCDVKKTQNEHDTISEKDLDDITLASNLTLDDTDTLSESEQVVVSQQN